MAAAPRQTICYAYCSAELQITGIRGRLVNKEVVYYTLNSDMVVWFFFSSRNCISFRNTCYIEGNMGLSLSPHSLCTDLTGSLTSETLTSISFLQFLQRTFKDHSETAHAKQSREKKSIAKNEIKIGKYI